MMNPAPEKKEQKYDLEERTARFGEAIIEFAKAVPKSVVTSPLISSVGARWDECWRELL